jgi:hypothetical protein
MRVRICASAGFAALALACAAMPGWAQGQAAAGDPTEGAFKLDLSKASPLHGGKWLLLEGRAGAKPAKFSLEGLGVMQPVVLSLVTKPPTAGVQLAASKPWSKAPPSTARSDAKGKAQLSFRVQGDALIQVQSQTEVPYQMMVWVGPELRPPLASPFKPATAQALNHPHGSKQ